MAHTATAGRIIRIGDNTRPAPAATAIERQISSSVTGRRTALRQAMGAGAGCGPLFL